MKKSILTIIILIIFLSFFGIFVSSYRNKYEVLDLISAGKILVDLNKNGIIDNGETICIEGIETFEQEDKQLATLYNLSNIDMINLWYLSKEYAQKLILNKKIKLEISNKENTKCKFAKIKIDETNYSELLYNKGFAFKNYKTEYPEKVNNNIKESRKLDLVILNHRSNKYHKLDCKYGNMAHDKIIIPRKQLPKGMKPCHYCHNKLNKKFHKKSNNNSKIYRDIPSLKLFNGEISLYKFDYTKNLKPNSYCNTDICKLLKSLIDNSNSSIDIAIYGYEDTPAITEALKKAKSRGVKIQFVFDQAQNPEKTFYKGNSIIENIAISSKSDLNSKEAGKLMHNKFMIFDDKKVLTGSMNFSKTGLSGYDANDVILINSPQIAKLYKEEFNQMLDGKFHNSKVKSNLPNKFNIGNSEIEIYFSPQDKSATRIIQLINNAKHYIYVPTFLITHKGITEALINAKNRSIDIKIIIDANSVNTRNTKHAILRENGIPVKAENYAGKLHSKTMIIDDTYIILGSMNFSNSGENKNDENMIVLKNTKFAQNYKAFFLYLWKLIPDKYLKYTPRAESKESIGSCQDGIDNNFDGRIDSNDIGCK